MKVALFSVGIILEPVCACPNAVVSSSRGNRGYLNNVPGLLVYRKKRSSPLMMRCQGCPRLYTGMEQIFSPNKEEPHPIPLVQMTNIDLQVNFRCGCCLDGMKNGCQADCL